jgi:hypothetical protein
LCNDTVNRFAHLHRSTDDLVNKVKMQRYCGIQTACCFQRCVGLDAANAIFSTTFECDVKHGTPYHSRFKDYWKWVQQEDLVVDGAMTDPDLYLRVKSRKPEGVMISGTFYIGFTAFFDPLRNHFGWSSARTAPGVSLQSLESGIAAPLIGYLFDRVGPRKLIPDPGQAGAIGCKSRPLAVKNYAAGLWLSIAVLKPELWSAGVLEYCAKRGIYSFFLPTLHPSNTPVLRCKRSIPLRLGWMVGLTNSLDLHPGRYLTPSAP